MSQTILKNKTAAKKAPPVQSVPATPPQNNRVMPIMTMPTMQPTLVLVMHLGGGLVSSHYAEIAQQLKVGKVKLVRTRPATPGVAPYRYPFNPDLSPAAEENAAVAKEHRLTFDEQFDAYVDAEGYICCDRCGRTFQERKK